MKRCLQCGKTTRSNNLTICSMCGGKLVNAEDFPETELYGAETEKTRYIIEKKENKSKTVFMVLLVIALVILIALCCFFAGQLYNKNGEETSSKKVDETTFEKEQHTEETQTVIETIPDDFDIEAEVKRIREKQTDVEKSEVGRFRIKQQTTAYYDVEGNLVKIVAEPDEEFGYTRRYYFENGELYFSFVFMGTDIENRLYFYSGKLFRWIDGPQGKQKFHDLEYSNSEFKTWEKIVTADAKQKYSMF